MLVPLLVPLYHFHDVKWSIASKVYGYASSLKCKLCLMENYWIIKNLNNPNLLNKRSDLINKLQTLK